LCQKFSKSNILSQILCSLITNLPELFPHPPQKNNNSKNSPKIFTMADNRKGCLRFSAFIFWIIIKFGYIFLWIITTGTSQNWRKKRKKKTLIMSVRVVWKTAASSRREGEERGRRLESSARNLVQQVCKEDMQVCRGQARYASKVQRDSERQTWNE